MQPESSLPIDQPPTRDELLAFIKTFELGIARHGPLRQVSMPLSALLTLTRLALTAVTEVR